MSKPNHPVPSEDADPITVSAVPLQGSEGGQETITQPSDIVANAASLPCSLSRYEIFDELGRGGMGVVYRARDTVLDREVALKVLSDRLPAGSGILRRFLDEARITAQLQHPGIPAVHDLGSLSDGRPYLAMKLVKGQTLASLLDARTDPLADRGRFLAVFEGISQAIAYAHEHRVIHRDLKPANVMVGSFGEVQVMDWGLAKHLTTGRDSNTDAADEATSAELTEIRSSRDSDDAQTRAGSILGTPAYMPPEQAIGAIDQIDERSDVFGLGAILCTILTGRPPFVGGSSEQARQMAARAQLSDAFARLEACEAEGELVALCRRCLSGEKEQRPANAGEVAQAMAQWRASTEEQARQAELERVRSAEQQKRRRLLRRLSVVAMLLLGLIAMGASGAAVRMSQLNSDLKAARDAADTNAANEREAREAADRALAAESKARAAERKVRDKTRATLRLMTDNFVENQLARAAQLTPEHRKFLQKVVSHYEGFAALSGDDVESRTIRAEGYYRVGGIRSKLGDVAAAETAYRDALVIRKQLVADYPDRPDFLQELADCYSELSHLLHKTSRPKEAQTTYQEVMAIRKQLVANYPDRPDFREGLANSHNNMGTLLKKMGQPQEAEVAYCDALKIYKQLVADFPTRLDFLQSLADGYNNLGVLMWEMDRLEDAEKAYLEARAIRRQLIADHPNQIAYREALARTNNDFGIILEQLGRLKEAEAAYKEALATYKKLVAEFPARPDLRNSCAGTFVNIASFCLRRRDFAAAIDYIAQAEPHLKAALQANPRHPSYRLYYRNHLLVLIKARAGLRQPAEALAAAKQVCDLEWYQFFHIYVAAQALAQCIGIVQQDEKISAGERAKAMQFYSDESMKMLQHAVAKGFKDAAQIKNDSAFQHQWQREDFKKLLADLEAKSSAIPKKD